MLRIVFELFFRAGVLSKPHASRLLSRFCAFSACSSIVLRRRGLRYNERRSGFRSGISLVANFTADVILGPASKSFNSY